MARGRLRVLNHALVAQLLLLDRNAGNGRTDIPPHTENKQHKNTKETKYVEPEGECFPPVLYDSPSEEAITYVGELVPKERINTEVAKRRPEGKHLPRYANNPKSCNRSPILGVCVVPRHLYGSSTIDIPAEVFKTPCETEDSYSANACTFDV